MLGLLEGTHGAHGREVVDEAFRADDQLKYSVGQIL
jgi:hypothetical protein